MDIPARIREKAPLMELKELETYFNKVWYLLEKMNPGTSLSIDKLCKTDTRELFIEIVKYYMDWNRHNYQDGISFKNGFLILVKHDISFSKGRVKNVEV
jgi:hypothetical protein